MSNVPANASTSAAQRRRPKPTRRADPKVTTMPATVTMLGVTGSADSSLASRWALRLTHAWNRVVNTRFNLLAGPDRRPCPRLLVHLDDSARHHSPGVFLGLDETCGSQPPPQLGVSGQHGHGDTQL